MGCCGRGSNKGSSLESFAFLTPRQLRYRDEQRQAELRKEELEKENNKGIGE